MYKEVTELEAELGAWHRQRAFDTGNERKLVEEVARYNDGRSTLAANLGFRLASNPPLRPKRATVVLAAHNTHDAPKGIYNPFDHLAVQHRVIGGSAVQRVILFVGHLAGCGDSDLLQPTRAINAARAAWEHESDTHVANTDHLRLGERDGVARLQLVDRNVFDGLGIHFVLFLLSSAATLAYKNAALSIPIDKGLRPWNLNADGSDGFGGGMQATQRLWLVPAQPDSGSVDPQTRHLLTLAIVPNPLHRPPPE